MKDKFNNAVGPQVRVEKPKAGKIIPVLAVVFMLAGLQSATQFFANEFGYQPQLGAHYQHIYTPWSILIWTYKWCGSLSGKYYESRRGRHDGDGYRPVRVNGG